VKKIKNLALILTYNEILFVSRTTPPSACLASTKALLTPDDHSLADIVNRVIIEMIHGY